MLSGIHPNCPLIFLSHFLSFETLHNMLLTGLYALKTKELDPCFCFGQVNRFFASFIKRPMGKFRGHDCSASLKSNWVKSARVRAGNVLKVERASIKSW
jgi:hypothetical protein